MDRVIDNVELTHRVKTTSMTDSSLEGRENTSCQEISQFYPLYFATLGQKAGKGSVE